MQVDQKKEGEEIELVALMHSFLDKLHDARREVLAAFTHDPSEGEANIL
jgi:hypothetical protein